MVYTIILAIAIVASYIILRRMIVRMAKYQNFKNNVLARLALSELFKEFEYYGEEMHKIDDADWMRIGMEKKEETLKKIKEKISTAIDEELDNDSDWKDTLVAINAEQRFFHVDNSYPFYQIFDNEIIKRFNERNKEVVKK